MLGELLLACNALTVHPLSRRSALFAAAVAAPLSLVHTPASYATASKLLDAAGISVKEPTIQAAPAATFNLAEEKLAVSFWSRTPAWRAI